MKNIQRLGINHNYKRSGLIFWNHSTVNKLLHILKFKLLLFLQFYKKQIPDIAKQKEIDKVVIDVRYNMGGSSVVGRSIFRSILPDAVKFNSRI